jgi:transcriptional regulator with XRE-family HTH domain
MTKGEQTMPIGTRIRELRAQKGMSQGDIEEITGLLRCYISRVENGHTIPSLETLERFAAALDIPLYRFFYTGEDLPSTPNLTPRPSLEQLAEEGGKDGASARFVLKLKKYADKIVDADREVLLTMAKRFAAR